MLVGRIGRGVTVALPLAFVLVLGIAGAGAAGDGARISCPLSAEGEDGVCTNTFPPLQVELGGEVTPIRLSRAEMQSVALDLQGRVSTVDGTHPPALREMTTELDRNVAINLKGVPACRPTIIVEQQIGGAARACESTIVGGGNAEFEIAFPEQPPMTERGPVTIYNGELEDGVRKLYVYAYVHVPVPAAIVSTIEIKRIHEGRYGSQAVIKVPVIAGGSGSLIDFDLHLKRLFKLGDVRRNVVTARCPKGQLDAEANPLIFKNEAHTPGAPSTTVIKSRFAIPCRSAN